MSQTHEHEEKQFIRLFQQQGIDQFDLKFKVLKAFLKLEHHVSIADMMAQLEKDGVSAEQAVVDDTMEMLCRFGFAIKNEFHQNDIRYEHRHLGLHHDHMICTKCGDILEFKDEALEKQQLRVADAYGFHMLQHRMEIYGICSKCMAHRRDERGQVSLDNAKQGEKLKITGVAAGSKMLMRFSSMGLKIGDVIEIVSSGFGGQMVIATHENRLVLGRGMAEKIKVRVYTEADAGAMDRVDEIMEKPLLLSQMKAGQEGVIRKVAGKGILRRRLLEMGINRGSRIYVEKYAPLKDPLELVVKGYHLSLRVEEAAHIFMEDVKDRKR